MFGIMALDAESDFEEADGLERKSIEAADRYDTYRTVSLGALITSALTGAASYLLFTAD